MASAHQAPASSGAAHENRTSKRPLRDDELEELFENLPHLDLVDDLAPWHEAICPASVSPEGSTKDELWPVRRFSSWPENRRLLAALLTAFLFYIAYALLFNLPVPTQFWQMRCLMAVGPAHLPLRGAVWPPGRWPPIWGPWLQDLLAFLHVNNGMSLAGGWIHLLCFRIDGFFISEFAVCRLFGRWRGGWLVYRFPGNANPNGPTVLRFWIPFLVKELNWLASPQVGPHPLAHQLSAPQLLTLQLQVQFWCQEVRAARLARGIFGPGRHGW